eukprot:12928354-Alexandrium_andersonii.AAC.1
MHTPCTELPRALVLYRIRRASRPMRNAERETFVHSMRSQRDAQQLDIAAISEPPGFRIVSNLRGISASGIPLIS